MGTLDARLVSFDLAAGMLQAALRAEFASAPPLEDGAGTALWIKRLHDVVATFAAMAEGAGARGLSRAAEWLCVNLQFLGQQARTMPQQARQRLADWSPLVLRYVHDGNADGAALVAYANLPHWTFRPSQGGLDNMRRQLDAFAHARPRTGAPQTPPTPPSPLTSTTNARDVDVQPAPAESGTTAELEPVLAQDAPDPSATAWASESTPAAATPAQTTQETKASPATLDDMFAALTDTAGALAIADRTQRADVLACYAAQLAQAVELAPPGLADACGLMCEHIRSLADAATDEDMPAWLLIALDFPVLARTCASALGERADGALESDAHQAAQDLLANVFDPAWGREVASAEQSALRLALGAPDFAAESTAVSGSAHGDTSIAPAGNVEPNEIPADGEHEAVLSTVDACPESAIDIAAPEPRTDVGGLAEPTLLEPTPPEPTLLEPTAIEPPELPAMQHVDPEHVTLLATEFTTMAAGLRADVSAARAAADTQQRALHVESCGEFLERVGNALEAANLIALRHVFAFVADRVLARTAAGFDADEAAWLAEFPQRVRAYLAAPADRSAASALVEALFNGGDWMKPEPAWATALEAALPRVQLVAAVAQTRVTTVEPVDVSLAIPPDINPELLEGLLSELPVQSADFAAAMQRLASGAGSMHDLEVAKRAAHTLKGAANTVGVRGIANLTHYLEDILIALTQRSRLPTRALAETLINAADCLEAMSEAVQGAAPAPDDALDVLQQVLAWANLIDRAGVPEEDAAAPAAVPAIAAVPAPPELPAAASLAQNRPATDEPRQPSIEPTLRVSATLIDEQLRLVGETMIANTQLKEQLRQSVEHQRALMRQQLAFQALTGELEHLIDVRGVSAPSQVRAPHGSGAAASAGPGAPASAGPGAPAFAGSAGSEFDALEFDHFNELHTVTRRLIEAATDARELSQAGEQRLFQLSELIDGQARLHLEAQGVVMKTRMVPVTTLVQRLHRSVRQTARLLGKRVALHVQGADTAIDGNVLNGLADPLMHLLRNAVDHGIESADARAATGKPAEGRIGLSFAREGTMIVVRCVDDGAGLNLERIRARAESKGLLVPGQPASDDELARLVLLPGFSTRDAATQVSGRGIGMDAVANAVMALNGTLKLHIERGVGLAIELRVPASLMTTHGLLVKMNDQVLAIASHGVADIRYVRDSEVQQIGAALVYRQGDHVHDLDHLGALLGMTVGAAPRDWFPALLVEVDIGAPRAVRVQDVLDSQEIVVKQLGRYVPRLHGVIGVTILGDGSIAPVIDLPQLLRAAAPGPRFASPSIGHRGSRVAEQPEQPEHAPRLQLDARRTALVVDDSLTARRVTASFMRDAGFDVRTAIDGMEAAGMLEKMVPHIMLVDMEMPRMNGLELTTHVRTREATRHVPIVMITSRSTDKHRKQAEAAGVNAYQTKPFAEDELLALVERLAPVTA